MESTHTFCYRAGVWYRTPFSYSDKAFEGLMELLDWRLPYNMQVYHSKDGDWRANRVLMARPVLPIEESKFFVSRPAGSLRYWDSQRRAAFPVCFRLGDWVIAQTEDCYRRFYFVGADTSPGALIAPLTACPISLADARRFVDRYHRHNSSPSFHKFLICLTAPDEPDPVGVVIASRPKARALDDGVTLEIKRCCSDGRYANVCSKLYGHTVRAGHEMGYRRFITYTTEDEPGSSLLAAGFRPVASVRPSPEGWDTPGRPRTVPTRLPQGMKTRWQLDL